MSYFTIGFVFLIIVGALSYVRRNKKKPAVNDQFAQTSPRRSGVSGWFMEWMDRLLGRKQKKTPQEFQTWAEGLEPLGSPPVSELKQWLAALEPQEVHKLMNEVAAFGAPFDFNLVWLLDEQLESNAQLKQALQETVALYCLANFKIRLVTDDIKAFIAWQAWQKNPNSKEQREFSQKLFAKLVDEGLAAPAPSDLFLASDKRRQKHAVTAIREVATLNPDGFNAALKEVVLSDKEPAPVVIPQPV